MIRIGITGANGFIGQSLLSRWSGNAKIVPFVRDSTSGIANAVPVGEIGPRTDWTRALSGIDVVVHCAGRAHILKDSAANPLQKFREINTAGTQKLAQDAVKSGVKRLVFLSSMGVMGEPNNEEGILKISDHPVPIKPYAISKWEAELALKRIESATNLEAVIVRPPLVYGRDAPANFHRMLSAIRKRRPLPLGKVNAIRSFVGIENLSDFLWICATAPQAAGGTYFVSDGEDMSVSELSGKIALELGVPLRLLPIPPSFLRLAGVFSGRKADIERILSNLRVDLAESENDLGWRPKHSVEAQLRRAFARH